MLAIAIKAHFDGKFIVPDEPLQLPKDVPLLLEIKQVPPPSKKPKRVPGLQLGKVWMSDDFDEPLTEEFLLGEE